MTLVLRAIACGVLNSFYIDLQNETPSGTTAVQDWSYTDNTGTVTLGIKSLSIAVY